MELWKTGGTARRDVRVVSSEGNANATATLGAIGDSDATHTTVTIEREYSRPSLILYSPPRPSSSLNQHCACSQSLGP